LFATNGRLVVPLRECFARGPPLTLPKDSEMITHHAEPTLSLRQWQDYAEAHPDSTIFHHRNWIQLLIDQYGLGLHIPCVMHHGQVVAGLPFLETPSVWGPRRLVALPFTDCVRVLADSDQTAGEFRSRLTPAQYGHYRAMVIKTDTPLRAPTTPSCWVRHTLDSSGGFERVAAGFCRRPQQNVRRAGARQLRFECRRDADALQVFYRLHLKTRHRLGVPVQPRKFFARLYQRILTQNLGFVGLVQCAGAPIAAGVFLTYKSAMVYKYVASEPASLEHRPNDYLTHEAIRTAAEGGFATFDFGVSRSSQEGLRRFKRKWGAVESDVVSEYLIGNTRPLIENSRALRVLSTAIRHTPPFLCRAVGAIAYPFSQ
jgi:CelD/BcsL family acetyltransferase involved in cellulose biosynthesis